MKQNLQNPSIINSSIRKAISDDEEQIWSILKPIIREGETYAISYTCESMKELHHYQVNFAPELRKKHLERYGKKVVAFRTLLEVVKEY